MNAISSIQLLFQMQNEDFARNLYGRWDSFFTTCVERVLDNELEKKNNESGRYNEIIAIENIDLDLGTINEDDLDIQFPIRLQDKLEEALIKWKIENGEHSSVLASINVSLEKDGKLETQEQLSSVSSLSTFNFQFSTLCHFLLHGALPWHTPNDHKDIRALFLAVLQNHSADLKSFLLHYGHYTSLQQRLVYQLGDLELERGVRLLQPGESVFICSYITLLRKKHRELHTPAIRESDYRNAVWYVVYSYLLQNTGTYFNRKQFVSQTVMQLSVKYNIGFDRLLNMITQELEQFMQNLTAPPDLFSILSQLRGELTEKNFRRSFTDGAKLYKVFYTVLRHDSNKSMSQDSRTLVIRILSRPDTCRLFLQKLNINEIRGLVPVIIPGDSRIVIEVAESLGHQKEKGCLQGKAGGEFRLIKWQIIFSVLLAGDTVSFNRLYFVEQVLQKISAHYNMDIGMLLQYICEDMTMLKKLDKNLVAILLSLYQKNSRTKNKTKQAQEDMLAVVVRFLRNDTGLTESQQSLLFKKLGDNLFCQRLTGETSEDERLRIVAVLFPENREHIIEYIQKLDILDKRYDIAGESGGNLARIKWDFLFEVLSRLNDKSFNQLDFVNLTLHRIAAHYNTTCLDLLYYFRRKEIHIQLPYRLQLLLDELFIRETAPWIKHGERDLAHTLLAQRDFITHAEPLFKLITFVNIFFATELKSKLPAKRLFDFLRQLSSIHKTLSQKDLILRFIDWLQKQIPADSRQLFSNRLEQWSDINNDLHQTITKRHHKSKIKANFHDNTLSSLQGMKQSGENKTSGLLHYVRSDENDSTHEPLFINNAGMVIFAPYLPRLFSMLALTENSQFKDTNAQHKAVYLSQYAVFEKTGFPEYELALNKILAGLNMNDPIPYDVDLTEEEKQTTQSMLEGVKNNWPKMQNTSMEGFRQSFLQREGKFEEKEDHYLLTVETKTYDMLIDTIPWNFKLIRFPWINKRIEVKWR